MFKAEELLISTNGRLVSGNIDTNIKGISIDSRTINPDEAFIAIKGNNFDGHCFIDEAIKKGAGCIISSYKDKGLRIKDYRDIVFINVKDTVKALGDIAKFHREKFNIPLIAVSGSNGKTTTKEMIAGVLARNFKVLKNEGTKNNHIGLPLTLLGLNASYDFAVLELGTNHPGEMEYLSRLTQPNIGVITNIGPAHLEHFSNLEGVILEKYVLIEYLLKPRIAILNADDLLLRKKIIAKGKGGVTGFILSFGIKNIADFNASGIRLKNEGIEFLLNKKYKCTLKTLGFSFVYDALIAVAIGRIFGLGYKEIVRQLANFNFPQGRLNLLKVNKIKFIDDTYNSNPASLKAALEALKNLKTGGRKIFIMGDMLELGEAKAAFHHQAVSEAREICDILIAVGKISQEALETMEYSRVGLKNIFTCSTSQEARDILFNRVSVQREDIVLVKGSRAMKMEEVFKI